MTKCVDFQNERIEVACLHDRKICHRDRMDLWSGLMVHADMGRFQAFRIALCISETRPIDYLAVQSLNSLGSKCHSFYFFDKRRTM